MNIGLLLLLAAAIILLFVYRHKKRKDITQVPQQSRSHTAQDQKKRTEGSFNRFKRQPVARNLKAARCLY